MLKAKDIMTPNPVTISPETGISDAVKLLLEKGFNGLPVVDARGRLQGVLCQSDLIAQQKSLDMPSIFSLLDGFIPMFGLKETERDIQRITALTVSEAMSKNPITATPETSLEELANLMVRSKYYSLPVVDQGKVVGIVGKEDILRTIVPAE